MLLTDNNFTLPHIIQRDFFRCACSYNAKQSTVNMTQLGALFYDNTSKTTQKIHMHTKVVTLMMIPTSIIMAMSGLFIELKYVRHDIWQKTKECHHS